MGYIGVLQRKEHSPEVWHVPPGTPCIYIGTEFWHIEVSVHCSYLFDTQATQQQGVWMVPVYTDCDVQLIKVAPDDELI